MWCWALWNPLRGCSRVSEGCRNCYAEKMAARFSGPGQPYEGLAVMRNGHAAWTGKVELVEKHLLDPLKWKKPLRIFVNSMSDLFHENVTDEMRDRIFAVMALCPQHIFQVLTKRPDRMLKYLSEAQHRLGEIVFINALRGIGSIDPESIRYPESRPWPLPNVWLGVSVENQAAADERIPLLLRTPAAVRFVSCEPLLGPVSLRTLGEEPEGYIDALRGLISCDGRGTKEIGDLGWVICGGESGPGARPMHPDFARLLRDQCAAAGVPFFFKQWGEYGWYGQMPDDTWRELDAAGEVAADSPYRIGKKAAGSLLDGVEYKAFPGMPA